MVEEIAVKDLNPKQFVEGKIKEIQKRVGTNSAIVALSGGVDSSVTTVLGYKALGENLGIYFIDNGLMREDEPQQVVSIFKKLGIEVKIIDAQQLFFNKLKGVTAPEQKREIITQTFYKRVFGRIIKESQAKFILQGTNFTDVEETVAGIKRQHNVFEQLGIDPQKEFGYEIIEPLVQLRKDGIRKVAEALDLPKSISEKIPFPGPALATRVIGEVTLEKIELVRKATAIVESFFEDTKAFQYLAVLHNNRVTGIRDGKRKLGYQIEVRCWDSTTGVTAVPTDLSYEKLRALSEVITFRLPEVVSVTYNITDKPPSTIEAI